MMNPHAPRMPASPLAVTVFADFASPHCWVTEAALRSLAGEHRVDLRYRAVEMHPVPAPLPAGEEVARWAADAAPGAAAAGLTIREQAFVPRTRKAHEACRFAAEHGLEGALRDALYRAYWGEGLDIGRIDVLAGIGEGIGLDPVDLKIALDIDRFGEAVQDDAGIARRLNVRVVPTVYVGSGPGARILVGMQSRSGLDAAVAAR